MVKAGVSVIDEVVLDVIADDEDKPLKEGFVRSNDWKLLCALAKKKSFKRSKVNWPSVCVARRPDFLYARARA